MLQLIINKASSSNTENNWTRIILIISIVIVLVVAIVSLVIVNLRIKKIKRDFLNLEKQFTEKENLILENENFGKVFFKIKDQVTNPLEDVELEFYANTIIKNEYKQIFFSYKKSEYEIVSLAAKTNKTITAFNNKINKNLIAKFQKDIETKTSLNFIDNLNGKEFQLIALDWNLDWKNEHDKYYPFLSKKGLLVLTNVNKNKKTLKDFIYYLKLIDRRYEYNKKSSGLIIIVK